MEPLFASTLLFGEEILNRIHIFAGSWLDMLMLIITSTGSEIFYMAALPILYWCWDRRRALFVGAVFLTAISINDATKYTFNHPRPDPAKLLPGIRELAEVYMPKGPGFPSGHAQGSSTFWGTIALLSGSRTVKFLCVAMIIFVCYSRLYMGVHFLGDVIGGLILGILCLMIIIPVALVTEKYYHSFNMIMIIAMLVIIPIIIYNIIPGMHNNTTMGTISGFLIGALVAENRIQFNTKNRFLYQLAKIVIGLAGVAAIRYGLKIILPDSTAAGFFRYWCIGFWCSFGAPFVFGKISALKGKEEDLL
jgi:membrane-associated phospholipid phosphatase